MTTTTSSMSGMSNNPVPSTKAFALHQRNSTAGTSSSSSTANENIKRSPTITSHYSSSGSISNYTHNSRMTPSQYMSRLSDISQMDIQSAFDQMKSLLHPARSHQVFKLSYYRKQTKGHYARDDPAFVTLQISFLVLTSVAYSIAFNSNSFFSTLFAFMFHSIIINYIGVGAIVATFGQAVANQYLFYNNNGSSNDVESNTVSSPSSAKSSPTKTSSSSTSGPASITTTTRTDTTAQNPVEWMYAFDIHCNAFFPFFIIIYILQYFFLPIVLSNTFTAFFISNTLYSVAFIYYFYITHLGYRNISELNHTEFFLAPIVVVVFIFLLNFIGYPFGLGWNASRIMAHLYFEA
mmetsp:Transcript_16603/g.24821  ORF Transcript_16603/g.24821 Transcript_16603/m.24821 type:complete len:350 (+) Transcript_16603:166-1215(+)|eukprot:CAMPEP_0203677628 /NCGR_PEP_ID=MMETSP0090-20130426/28907_1 /ASSEMBLY_ACC=CAM_ASM_001088 /TAXON_ID=426623 /ORGANISM="Chaetoceros affinis, Strain CCMP159" /LENGTH=349 /DNA_ID=CAMNT_0050544575 /DNA_START=126 /DNA_END=1175 /DNA_ORIENTATION=+